jgi:sigma-B regulation protein RsbU (phosphoserine phosphatase)
MHQHIESGEKKFRALLEYASIAIVIVDGDANIQLVNAKAEEFFGYRREELIGQSVHILVPDALRELHTRHCEKYRKSPRTRTVGQGYELRARRKDGSEFTAEIGLSAIDTDEGQLVLCYIIDVTTVAEAKKEQARLQEELHRANAELEQRVEERTRELRKTQAQLLAQQRLQQEVELAMDIQRSLLPHQVPELAGYDFAADARPARYVSGDFYDFAGLSPTACHIIVADIAGKGIPAALLSSTARSLFRMQIDQKASPSAILRNVNSSLYQDLESAETFITSCAAHLDAGTGRLAYANAGHTEIIWWRAAQGAHQALGVTGMPLGIDLAAPLTESEVALRPGDVVLFYTDGITEAANAKGELFGMQRLTDLLATHAAAPAEDMLQAIVSAIESFQAGTPLSDDVTLIVLKAQPRTLEFTFPATLDHLEEIVARIVQATWVYGKAFASHIELAASEIVTNIISHAYGQRGGELRIRLTLEMDRLQIDTYDDGDTFDIDQVPEPDLDPDPDAPQEGGFGLFLVRQVTDEVTYEPGTKDGNHWRIVKFATDDQETA